jgi:hypothetical protein
MKTIQPSHLTKYSFCVPPFRLDDTTFVSPKADLINPPSRLVRFPRHCLGECRAQRFARIRLAVPRRRYGLCRRAPRHLARDRRGDRPRALVRLVVAALGRRRDERARDGQLLGGRVAVDAGRWCGFSHGLYEGQLSEL